jgi:RecA/RadA recombinase
MADKDKLKALELAVGQIEKQFGKGSIMRLDKDAVPTNIAAISTGSLGLDVALGIGGVPRGRIIEIYGPESSGKTTLALNIIAQAQKLGGQAAFIDAEHALDVTYARKLGVKSSSPSRTPASKRSRSPKPWSGAAPSTLLLWIPWRHSHRALRSRARWATPTWASRRGS